MTWTVSDVMTIDPVSVGPATTFKACANVMRIHEVGAIPVVSGDDRLIGIISESDLLARQAKPEGGKAKAMRAAELMTADLVTTTAGSPLATAASLMFQHHVRVLPVVDSRQHLVGTVSRAQILKAFLRSDESIRKDVVGYLCDISSTNTTGHEVEVRDGVVHVYGVQEADNLSEVIGRLVMGIPGVVGVKSHPNLVDREIAPGGERHG